MSSIVTRKVNGTKYYYEIECFRKDGKIKQRVLQYYGKIDPRKKTDAKPITKNTPIATYRFGDVALLYHAAKQIKFIETINDHVEKRQGLNPGLELFLTAAHRLLGDKPSSANLPGWLKTTHLPALLGFNAEDVTSNTQQYLFDKIYEEKTNTDHLLGISKSLYDAALPLFGKEDKTFFYDITTTYFEGTGCPIAYLGYAHGGPVDKLQVNIGLVLNRRAGIPLMSKVFEGNVNDVKTVFEMVYFTKFVLGKKHGFIVMDRGMDSEMNVRILDGVGYEYIIGISAKHAFVKKLKSDNDPSDAGWTTFENNGQTIKVRKFTKNLFGKRRIIVLYYNRATAESQSENRQRRIDSAICAFNQEEKLSLKKLRKLAGSVAKYFVFKEAGKTATWRLDKTAMNRAEKLDGKFCMITNTGLDGVEVYKTYFSKDKIEKVFRYMKQDVGLQPTRKRLADHVRADVFICHLGYLLLAVVEHLVHKKKNSFFWDGMTSEAKEIRLLEYADRSDKKSFLMLPNNEIQRFLVGEFDLGSQVPRVVKLSK
jgi:transposase